MYIFIPIIAHVWSNGHLVTEQMQLLTQIISFGVISQSLKNDIFVSRTKRKVARDNALSIFENLKWERALTVYMM